MRAAPVISTGPGPQESGDLGQRAGIAVEQEGKGRFRPDQVGRLSSVTAVLPGLALSAR